MRRQFLVPCLLCALALRPAGAEEIVYLTARAGATLRYSVLEPDSGAPQAAAILFPGNGGAVRLHRTGGAVRFVSSNFLVRARDEFARRGVAAAVIDTPSDRPGGMSDAFRAGAAHRADVRAVIADLERRYGAIPIFLVGTSRGTVSAAHLAAALDGIAGVVLASTVFRPSNGKGSPGLSGFDFSSIEAPLLLVHHRDDGCRAAPYEAAQALGGRYPLITVAGGDPVRPGRCSAWSEHGFFGQESATVKAIVDWMEGRPYDREID